MTGTGFDEISAVVVGVEEWGEPNNEQAAMSLREELRLSKAGALYADHVDLLSLASATTLAAAQQAAKEASGDSSPEDLDFDPEVLGDLADPEHRRGHADQRQQGSANA